MYRVMEQEDFVVSLSHILLSTHNKTKLLKDVNPEAIIESIDVVNIKALLGEFTLEKCKVVIVGGELCQKVQSVEELPCL